MTPSAADETHMVPPTDDTHDALIGVGVVLTPDRGLLSGAVEMVVDRATSLQLVTIRTDRDGWPIRDHINDLDIVIVDRIAVATRFLQASPRLRAIMLVGSTNPDEVLASIRAGISAFIDDRMSPGTLVHVIERVHAGDVVFEPSVLVELLQRQNVVTFTPPNRTARLSDRELEVLAALARGASTAEAAEEFGISLNTIRTHLKNILAKIGARSKLEAVIIALREGRISLERPKV